VVGDIVRQSVLNDTVEFTVDAGRAGFGNLEMAIKDNEGIIIPSHVSQLEAGAAKFLVTFTPNLPGTHTVWENKIKGNLNILYLGAYYI